MNILSNSILEVWNPLVGVCFFLLIVLFVYFIRSCGEGKCQEKTEQTRPFFSGNLPSQNSLKIHKVYWGFFEALKGYYHRLKAIHNGIINDYVYWFVLVVVIILILFVIL